MEIQSSQLEEEKKTPELEGIVDIDNSSSV